MTRDLAEQGYAVARGVLSGDDVEAIAEAFAGLADLARSLPGTCDVRGSRFVLDADPFRLRRIVWCGGAAPVLGRYGEDPRILRLAATALGRPDLVQIIQQAHYKLPGDGVDFAWHQDASNRRYGREFDDVDGRGAFVQVVVAVDAMDADNGGLQVIPGSHRAGFLADPDTGALPPVNPDDAVAPSLEPGDALLFGPFLVHGSAPNHSTRPRRLFIQGYAAPGANRRVYPGCGTGVARRLA
ncbi:MAG: phytanoyl-CoA dioxygenase family protein [Myxococcota bacterium]